MFLLRVKSLGLVLTCAEIAHDFIIVRIVVCANEYVTVKPREREGAFLESELDEKESLKAAVQVRQWMNE